MQLNEGPLLRTFDAPRSEPEMDLLAPFASLAYLAQMFSKIIETLPKPGWHPSFILDFVRSGRFTTGPTMNALLSIPTLSLALLGLMLTCAG